MHVRELTSRRFPLLLMRRDVLLLVGITTCTPGSRRRRSRGSNWRHGDTFALRAMHLSEAQYAIYIAATNGCVIPSASWSRPSSAAPADGRTGRAPGDEREPAAPSGAMPLPTWIDAPSRAERRSRDRRRTGGDGRRDRRLLRPGRTATGRRARGGGRYPGADGRPPGRRRGGRSATLAAATRRRGRRPRSGWTVPRLGRARRIEMGHRIPVVPAAMDRAGSTTARPLGYATTLHSVDLLDSYTGHVEPGGPAARRDLPAVSITKVSVGPMDNNAYVLVDKATGQALLIDAANETDRLLDTVDTVADREKLHGAGDHPQALGPHPVAGGGRRRDAPAHLRARARRPRAAGHPRHPRRRRRHDPVRRLVRRDDPPRRPHAWLDRPAVPRPGGHGPHLHRRLALPGGPRRTTITRRTSNR